MPRLGAREWRGATGLAALLAWGLIWGGCSEKNGSSPIRAHPPEWSDPSKLDWHGDRVERDGPGLCASCHGGDLRGDVVVPGCYDCHDGPGGHPAAWAKRPAPLHGTQVQLEGPQRCTACHGPEHRGGWSGVSCFTCHAGGPSGHPDGWLTKGTPTFHGLKVALEGNLDCRRCHGNDLMGGTSGVACGDCHF